MLNYYQRAGLIKDDLEFLMAIIDEWYGSYLFSKYADSNERLYNSDMVLYFLKEYFKNQAVPEDLIDRNVRIDYEKLRHLIVVDRGEGKVANGNFNRLREIIEQGEIAGRLAKGFSIEKLVDENNMEPFLAVYKGIRYAYALEIKYIKRGKKTREWTEAEIRRLQAEAEAQLKHYTDDEKLRKSIQKTTLIRLVLIFSGHQLLHINEIKEPPSP
jgi:hypothetical protein